MSLRTKRESARDQVLDALEARFYEFAAEFVAGVEHGTLDYELEQGVPIRIELQVEAPLDLRTPEARRSWFLG